MDAFRCPRRLNDRQNGLSTSLVFSSFHLIFHGQWFLGKDFIGAYEARFQIMNKPKSSDPFSWKWYVNVLFKNRLHSSKSSALR